ncbi:MAG: HAD family hydrolase [Planctomycetota bacterium]
MWSGPRNLSTALMRSFGSRVDCAVIDEPLYAHYLSTLDPEHRATHPMADEVIASQPTDWQGVAANLRGPVPDGKPVWYQKHMAHHLTEGMDLAWIEPFANAFLIRDPAEMITSFIRVIPDPTPEDLGLPQQVELFRRVGGPVVDSKDILLDPRGTLSMLCEALGVAFDEAMLSWEPGPRETDGVWAPHWYASVENSTGFGVYRPKNEPVPDRLRGVLDRCNELYAELARSKIA